MHPANVLCWTCWQLWLRGHQAQHESAATREVLCPEWVSNGAESSTALIKGWPWLVVSVYLDSTSSQAWGHPRAASGGGTVPPTHTAPHDAPGDLAANNRDKWIKNQEAANSQKCIGLKTWWAPHRSPKAFPCALPTAQQFIWPLPGTLQPSPSPTSLYDCTTFLLNSSSHSPFLWETNPTKYSRHFQHQIWKQKSQWEQGIHLRGVWW